MPDSSVRLQPRSRGRWRARNSRGSEAVCWHGGCAFLTRSGGGAMPFLLSIAVSFALQLPEDPSMRVDWSTAVGADSAIADVRRDYVRAVNSGDGLPESLFTADALAARG